MKKTKGCFTDLFNVINEGNFIYCTDCGVPAETDDIVLFNADNGTVQYQCKMCKMNWISHIDIHKIEENAGIHFEIGEKDEKIGFDIILNGKVVNVKKIENKMMEKISYKKMLEIMTSKNNLRCFKCKKPLAITEITTVDLDKEHIVYKCAECQNHGFRTMNKKLISILELKEEDFDMNVDVRKNYETINKKFLTVNCERCGTSINENLSKTVEKKKICIDCYFKTLKCTSCSEFFFQENILFLTPFEIPLCIQCAQNLKSCISCGNSFSDGFLIGKTCVFCAHEGLHIKK